MQAVVLAAGKGTRMRSNLPKVLHQVLGKPLLYYVLAALGSLRVRDPLVVVGYEAGQVVSFLRRHRQALGVHPETIVQYRQLGTGHALLVAKKRLHKAGEDVLIWPSDMPLLGPDTLRRFIVAHARSGSEASVLSALSNHPAGYGRILRAGGRFYAIREELDASESERRVPEINTGVYLFKSKRLASALARLRPNNKKKEFYLTDVIEILSSIQCPMEAFPLAREEEARGINSRGDLAEAVRIMNHREIAIHMARGVTFVAPEQTFIEPGVAIGRDTVIYPWCYVESGVKIGASCQVGPFAKIRKGTVIGDGSVIGSFVEVSRSKIGKKVYAKHLAYLGDAVIGDGTNVGAGTITANYDGIHKNPTKIGKKVSIGSDTVFIAPVTVGDRAQTGAGAVVTSGTRIKKGQTVAGVPAKPILKKRKKT